MFCQKTYVYENVKKIKLSPKDTTVLETFNGECAQRDVKSSLICNLEEQFKKKTFNLFDMAIDFFEKETNNDFQYF